MRIIDFFVVAINVLMLRCDSVLASKGKSLKLGSRPRIRRHWMCHFIYCTSIWYIQNIQVLNCSCLLTNNWKSVGLLAANTWIDQLGFIINIKCEQSRGLFNYGVQFPPKFKISFSTHKFAFSTRKFAFSTHKLVFWTHKFVFWTHKLIFWTHKFVHSGPGSVLVFIYFLILLYFCIKNVL
jgi:hypothetical protein